MVFNIASRMRSTCFVFALLVLLCACGAQAITGCNTTTPCIDDVSAAPVMSVVTHRHRLVFRKGTVNATVMQILYEKVESDTAMLVTLDHEAYNDAVPEAEVVYEMNPHNPGYNGSGVLSVNNSLPLSSGYYTVTLLATINGTVEELPISTNSVDITPEASVRCDGGSNQCYVDDGSCNSQSWMFGSAAVGFVLGVILTACAFRFMPKFAYAKMSTRK